MRTHVSVHAILAAAALCATFTTPAAAQQSVAPGVVRLAANAAPAARAGSGTRTLATYDFNSSFQGMPSRVTVSDSAGALVASFRPHGGGSERPMTVTTTDRTLRLQGTTVGGVLTIVLVEQNDRMAPGTLLGTWTLGSVQGELRAREVR